MLRLKKVAITGTVSCGKTLFCSFLKECGAYVVSADEIVHQQLSPDTDLGKKVITLLGPQILAEGRIDRKAVAEKVFDNPQLLEALERIIHPEVFRQIEKEYLKAEQSNAKLFIAEIPLLFEVGADRRFDEAVAVVADENLCMERFARSTGNSKEEYQKRMSRQLPQKVKAARANHIILNDGSQENLRAEAKKLFHELINQ